MRSLEGQKGRSPRCRRHGCSETCANLEMVAASGGTYTERLSRLPTRMPIRLNKFLDRTTLSLCLFDLNQGQDAIACEVFFTKAGA